MRYEIRVSADFAASHQLRLPDGSLEPLHFHGWAVVVTLASPSLDAMDCVVDFHEVQRQLHAITGPWDRKCLNDFEPFNQRYNPSAERVAQVIAERLQVANGVELVSVEVGEATGCVAVYRP